MRRDNGVNRSWGLGVVLVAGLALAPAVPVSADDYDAQRAGHPVRMAAYALHPIGVILDWLLFRPAHFLGSLEPLRTLFGHEVERDH